MATEPKDPFAALKKNAIEATVLQLSDACCVAWGQAPGMTYNQSKTPGVQIWRLETGCALVEWKGASAIIPVSRILTFMFGAPGSKDLY